VTLSGSVRASLEEATATYELFAQGARSYLEARGIDLKVAATFRLGVVEIPVVGHEMFEGRLAIPYLTKAGVVNLKFRCMYNHDCEGHGKYLGLPNSKTNVYNTLAFHRDSSMIAICEGEFDALVLDSLVGIPAVAIPGVQNWKAHYERCFVDYERVLIFADGDDPGKDFGKHVSSRIDGCTVIGMPHGTDVNTIYLSEGAEGLRKRAGLWVDTQDWITLVRMLQDMGLVVTGINRHSGTITCQVPPLDRRVTRDDTIHEWNSWPSVSTMPYSYGCGTVMTDEAPDISWTAAWGEDVREGDLIRINKLGGPVRIKSLRRWIAPVDKRGPMPEGSEDSPWYYGAVVEDRIGGQFHLYLQPHEAVFVALNVPDGFGPLEEGPGSDEWVVRRS
jgi:hypothetical protein